MNVHDPRPGRDQGPADRSIHPGSGRRKTRNAPRGRQVDEASLEEVRALLGDRPRLAAMALAAAGTGVRDGDERLADLVLRACAARQDGAA